MRLTKRQFLLAAGVTAAGIGRGTAEPAGAAEAGAAAPLSLKAAPLSTPDAAPGRAALSFDGSPGGPVLRIAKGAALDVRLANDLDGPIALQWHGLRAPNAAEGNWPLAGEAVAPKATRSIRFVPPDSGLTWFHPAALPGQPDLTARGLRGVLIVAEPEPPVADRDLLLSIAEAAAGPAQEPPSLTVNGQAAPERATLVPGARLRLRVVNMSTARPLILTIEGARPLIIAIDGQPSDLFEPVRDAVPVGPGARFEFMIDLSRESGATLRLATRIGAEPKILLECRTEGAPRDPLPPIGPLPRNPLLSPAIPLEKSVRAVLRIEAVAAAPADRPARWRLNGTASLDLAKVPLLSVARGGTVTLGFENRSAAIVPLRVHGHVMRLLHARDDGWEPYWRDSVILLPNSMNHVAFVADNPGRWLIESALFEQAALGLRSWFAVT